MKYKGYIYPLSARSRKARTGIYNPYIDNFIQSVGNNIEFLNKNAPSTSGFIHFSKYIKKTDVLFLNWIEDLPDKKWGFIQTMFFLSILRMKRLLRIKIVWTLHNKISHSTSNLKLKRLIFNSLLKRSDLIITHAKEGVSFAESIIPGISSKVFYFPHPIIPFKQADENLQKKYDYLIWGTVTPYKGIDKFLQHLEINNKLDKYRIMIAGKVLSEEFYNTLSQYQSENIFIRNEFVDPETLTNLIRQSESVLFTHSGDSVLSSGVLIDSVAHHAHVVGPHVGAFKEMGEMGIIKTYSDFDDLMKIMDNKNGSATKSNEKISEFIKQHSWAHFNSALKGKIKFLMKKQKNIF
jgi:beta-1,4-mannosyltransferase